MSFGLLFWVLMILWLLFGFWWNYNPSVNYGPIGNHVLLFVLFMCLGWAVFGAPIHG